MKASPIVTESFSTSVKPFTLSLSKRRARLRQAQPERVFEIQSRRIHQRDGHACRHAEAGSRAVLMKKILMANRGVHAAGRAKQIARARAACRRAMEPRGHSL